MLSNEELKKLDDVLLLNSLADFSTYGDIILAEDEKRRHIHIKRSLESKVLAVAHLDYVKFHHPTYSFDRRNVRCGQLDDRLGAWLILEYLQQFLPENMPYDILLTDNEERGGSTARYFDPGEHNYNWMFEWDRHGTDVVMYRYENNDLKKRLKAYDFEVGTGSFTDICELAHLGIVGINFGTGYHAEHTDNCWASLDQLMGQVEKFIPFYTDHYEIRLKGNIKQAQSSLKSRRAWDNNTHYGYNQSNRWNGKFFLSPQKRNEFKPPMDWDEYCEWQEDCLATDVFLTVPEWRKNKIRLERENARNKKKQAGNNRKGSKFDPAYTKRYKKAIGISEDEYELYRDYCIDNCSEIEYETYKELKAKGTLPTYDINDLEEESLTCDRGFQVTQAQKEFLSRIDNPTDNDPYDPSDNYYKKVDWDSLSEEEWKKKRTELDKEKHDWDGMSKEQIDEEIADLLGKPHYRSDQYYDALN